MRYRPMAFIRTLPDPAPKQCPGCGEWFLPPRKHAGQKFCGHPCAFKVHQPGRFITEESIQKNADARRGGGEGKSYIKRNGRHEHRIVAEQKLGRPLLPGEIAHHVDENKRNNAPDNIDVLPSQAEHARLHFTKKRRP